MSRAVRLDVGAVDGCAPSHRTGCCQRLNQINPEPFARPPVEAIVNCARRTILPGAVTPAAPGLENVDDAGNNTAVVNPPRTPLFLGNSGSITAHCSSDNQNKRDIQASKSLIWDLEADLLH